MDRTRSNNYQVLKRKELALNAYLTIVSEKTATRMRTAGIKPGPCHQLNRLRAKERRMSVYSLEKEDRESVHKIFENLDQLTVVKETKEKMKEMVDAVCDSLTDYMQDEYVLQFEEIVLHKARKIVSSLLKGEDLKAFGLSTDTRWSEPGSVVSYDNDGVRKRIVEHNIASIRTAEMVALKEENNRLQRHLIYLRERR